MNDWFGLFALSWIVVRVDGRSFHRLTSVHKYDKSNDDRGLALMNECAREVMTNIGAEAVLAYGHRCVKAAHLVRDGPHLCFNLPLPKRRVLLCPPP